MPYTPLDIAQLWAVAEPQRADLYDVQRRYEGAYCAGELTVPRLDGRIKSRVITNWIQYIAHTHAGFLLSHCLQFTRKDPLADTVALDGLADLYTGQALDEIDYEHLVNALLYGYSVEVHSYNGEGIQITRTNPLNWSFVRDENLNIVAGIYRAVLPPYTVYAGNLLTLETVIYYVYESEKITVYSADAKGNLSTVSESAHNYGGLPLAIFSLSREMRTFISPALRVQCDVYDVIRSSLTDDIKHNVDSLLMTKNMNYDKLLEKDPDTGVTKLQLLKAMGLFPLPDGADASYLTRVVDIEKFRYDLQVTRASIHLMGAVPDLDGTIGGDGSSTINNISGIALRLLFQSMYQTSARFEKYFTAGLRKRVDLINRINGLRSQPQIVDYDMTFQRQVPQVDAEWLQYLPNMQGIIPEREIFRLLPFITNPERVYAEWLDAHPEGEAQDDASTISPPNKGINMGGVEADSKAT